MIRRYDKERGAFVDVEAVYATVDGVKRQVWPDRLYLYKAGDECNDVTGGWVGGSGGNLGYNHSSGEETSGTIKIAETTRIGFANSNNTSHYVSVKYLRTGRKVDMTRYNKLVAKIMYTGRDSTQTGLSMWHGVGLNAGNFNAGFNYVTQQDNHNSPVDVVVEVSVNLASCVGDYYMVVFSHHVRHTSNTSHMYLYEAYLTV